MLSFVSTAFKPLPLSSRLLRSSFTPSCSPRPLFHPPPPLYASNIRIQPIRFRTAMTQSNPVSTAANASLATAPVEKHLKDYKPPFYTISNTNLHFSLDDDGLNTLVSAKLTIAARDTGAASSQPLILDGEDLELLPDSLKISGNPLPSSAFIYDSVAGTLSISHQHIPDGSFQLESAVKIKPAKNTVLEGLYMTSGDYCTQCEAEGFRRITFYIDRPDVMAKFSVRVEADRTKYPVLLSNGNCVDRGDAQDGRHWAQFDDLFPKPCYLFALVAGDLSCMKDEFITMAGRKVALSVFVKGENEVPKCAHAMASLKRAMKWDEVTYGLKYDYNIFNIVAVPSFIFGAMVSFISSHLSLFPFFYIIPESISNVDYLSIWFFPVGKHITQRFQFEICACQS